MFAVIAVRFDVAQIVDAQHSNRNQSRSRTAKQSIRRNRARQGEHSATGGHQSEENEYEDLTQIVVAVWVFTADIEPAGRQTCDADQNEPPISG